MKISSLLLEESPELSLGSALLVLGGDRRALGGNRDDNLGLGLEQTSNSERLAVLLGYFS